LRMLNSDKMKKLKDNWRESGWKSDCKAEAKFYDPASKWSCYIIAVDPRDEDTILCILQGESVEMAEWRLSELATRFNRDGEYVKEDPEYRPIAVETLLNRLRQDTFRYG
jgi:hypothetical protein